MTLNAALDSQARRCESAMSFDSQNDPPATNIAAIVSDELKYELEGSTQPVCLHRHTCRDITVPSWTWIFSSAVMA